MSYQFAVGDEIGLLKYVDVEQPEEEGGELSVTVRDIVGAPSRAHKIDMLNLSDCTDYLMVCRSSGYVDILPKSEKKPVKTVLLKDGPFVGAEMFGQKFIVCSKSGLLSLGSLEDDVLSSHTVATDVSRMRMSYDSSKVAIGGIENDLSIFDVTKGFKEPVFKAKNVKHDFLDMRVPVLINDLSYANEGNDEILVANKNKLRLYDTRVARRPVKEHAVSENPVLRVQVGKTKEQVYFTCHAGEVYRVDLRNLKKAVSSYKGAKGRTTDFALVEDKPGYLVSVSTDRYMRVFDLEKNKQEAKIYLKQHLTSIALL